VQGLSNVVGYEEDEWLHDISIGQFARCCCAKLLRTYLPSFDI
jgi:hypothetical protein